MAQLGPQQWLDWLDENFEKMEKKRLRIGLRRMIVFSDEKGLYYLHEGEQRPFSELIVQLVKRKVSDDGGV